MNTSIESTAFERATRHVMHLLLAGHESELVSLRPEPDIAARVEVLAARANDGALSEDERHEYLGYVRANKFVAVLQRQARKSLESQLPVTHE